MGSRRADIAIMAGLGALVLLVLAALGALGVAAAILACAALAVLAGLYGAATRRRGAPPEEAAAAPAPPPELDSPADDIESAMIERLPDPVLLIGPGGRIDRANAAARAFLAGAGEGVNLAAVLRQPDVLEAASSALRGETPEPVAWRILAPYERHARAFAAPLPGGANRRAGAILVLHDETDMRRAERMRADFLANASHELRTPLASLSGFIETLRGHARNDPEARERFLEVMQGQAERMRRLINDLLSLSRIEMDEHLPPAGQADLGAVAGDVAAALRPIAEARGVAILLDLPEGGARAAGDRDLLTAAVQNLVDNALKYSPRGGAVRVTARAGLSPAEAMRPDHVARPDPADEAAGRFAIVAPSGDGAMAMLRVTDDGPGIPRDRLPRLAQRFYRVEEGKSRDRDGTGLGLAIVKHIVMRHRGGLMVESAAGGGACFTLCVPMATDPPGPPAAP